MVNIPPVLTILALLPRVRLEPLEKVPDVRVNIPFMVLENPIETPEEL